MTTLEEYKKTVYDAAVKARKELGKAVCDEGFEDFLEELDLTKFHPDDDEVFLKWVKTLPGGTLLRYKALTYTAIRYHTGWVAGGFSGGRPKPLNDAEVVEFFKGYVQGGLYKDRFVTVQVFG